MEQRRGQTQGRETRVPRVIAVGTVATVGAIGLITFATFAAEKREEELGGYFMLAAFLVVVGALVFGLIAARPLGADRAAKRGLLTSAVGLVTMAAFWSGLPVILGAAGAFLGYESGERGRAGTGRTGIARTAFVMGLAAIVGAVVLVIGDRLR